MSETKNKPSTKIFSIVCTVITAVIAILAAAIIVNMIVCRAQKRPVSFFGTSFAIVQTESMEPEILKGDLILFKSAKYENLKKGDIIVFVAGDGFGEQMKGQNIVHRVHEITPDGIITKGDNNTSSDKDMVTADNFIGVCTSHSTSWGKIFSFFGKYGLIFLIVAVALPIICSQTLKIVKLSKAKNDDEDNALPSQDTSAAGGDLPPQSAGPENESHISSPDSSEDKNTE